MYDKVPVKVLQRIFNLIEEKNLCRVSISNAGFAEEICGNGWTFRWELEDMLLCTDSRFNHMDLDDLAELFELPLRWAYRVPRFETTEPCGTKGISAIDAAALCIHLEAIGFNTQPRALVERLAPTIDKQGYVNDSELLILRYKREQLRSRRILKADQIDQHGEWVDTRVKGSDGRRIKLTRVGGVAYRLDATGPKYRLPKDRDSVKCPTCHSEYTPGDRESALSHRTEHAKRMRVFDPKPMPALARRLATVTDPELVQSSSPLWMHKAVYQRAVYFRREFSYDFIQWGGSETEKNDHPRARGHLFSNSEPGPAGRIVGACAFWNDEQDGWVLKWVWLCPPARRTGALSRRWPEFLARYGDFIVETPLSDAMRAFLAVHGTPAQRSATGIA